MGGVRRIFLSNKRRKSQFAFGFVEFYTSEQMHKAVREMNGKVVKGCCLLARPAVRINKPIRGYRLQGDSFRASKVKKAEYYSEDQDLRIWIDRTRKKGTDLQDRQWWGLNILPSQEWRRKLFKSITLELDRPMAFNVLRDAVTDMWRNHIQIIPLSQRKYLVVFASEYECAIARERLQAKGKVFPFQCGWGGNIVKMRKQDRMTWIELRGLPASAWEHQSICKIAEKFGKPIKVLRGRDLDSFFVDVMILVNTQIQGTIEEQLLLKIDDRDEFVIMVVERPSMVNWDGEVNMVIREKNCEKAEREWPALSGEYSNIRNPRNQRSGNQSDGTLGSYSRVLPTPSYREVVRSLERNDQNQNPNNNELAPLRSEGENSIGYSFDLNRSPHHNGELDLDPHRFRAESGYHEDVIFNQSRDLIEEVTSNFETSHLSQKRQYNSGLNNLLGRPINESRHEVTEQPQNEQHIPTATDEIGANTVEEDAQRKNSQLLSSVERQLEIARLIDLPIGDVNVLSEELREGIERRENLPTIWEVEKTIEEDEDDGRLDHEGDMDIEVGSTKQKKSKSKGKKKVKLNQSLRGKCCQAILEQLDDNIPSNRA